MYADIASKCVDILALMISRAGRLLAVEILQRVLGKRGASDVTVSRRPATGGPDTDGAAGAAAGCAALADAEAQSGNQ